MDTKLKPLYCEISFWVMMLMSLPGIVAIYIAAINGIQTGDFDPSAFQSAFLASPIIAYLLARQYPRGKAVEAFGTQAAAALITDGDMEQHFQAGYDAAREDTTDTLDQRYAQVHEIESVKAKLDDASSQLAAVVIPPDPPGTHPIDAAAYPPSHYLDTVEQHEAEEVDPLDVEHDVVTTDQVAEELDAVGELGDMGAETGDNR